MGLASSPSNFVEATARRLRPWQILYEPGNEQPLEGKYNNPLTAEFCSPNGPTRNPKSSGDGCETHKDSISSLRKVTTFPSQTRNEGGSIKLDRRTQSSDLANSVTGASAPTGSAAGSQQPARSRQQPAASRPPAGQSELGAALDPRPTCTSTAGACESADSQSSDKSEILGNIRGRNEETPVCTAPARTWYCSRDSQSRPNLAYRRLAVLAKFRPLAARGSAQLLNLVPLYTQ